jgi:hypothetical protein
MTSARDQPPRAATGRRRAGAGGEGMLYHLMKKDEVKHQGCA